MLPVARFRMVALLFIITVEQTVDTLGNLSASS